MSDLQPRKRKDKRRKKGPFKEDSINAEDVVSGTTTTKEANAKADDYNIHVHQDAHTGGGWCAKIVFFILLSILGLLIGVIIFEYRGSSDLDAPVQDSKYAEIFHGWVDDSPPSHDDEHEHAVEEDHDDEGHSEEESEDHELSDEEQLEEVDEASEEDQPYEEENEDSEEGDAEKNDEDEASSEQEDEIDNEGDDQEDNISAEEILNALDNLEDDEPLEEVDDNEEDSNEVIDNNPIEAEMLKQAEEEANEVEEESSGVAVKFGVGVALVVVAHLVLVRKWNNAQLNVTSPELTSSSVKNSTPGEPPTPETLSRRNTIVPTCETVQSIHEAMEKARHEPIPSLSDEEYEEEESEEEEDEEEEEEEVVQITQIKITEPEKPSSVVIEEKDIPKSNLLATLETPVVRKSSPLPSARTPSPLFPDSEEEEEEVEEEEVEEAEEEEAVIDEDDDEELLSKLEAKYGKLPTKQIDAEEVESEEEEEEEEEEEDDETFPSWRRVKPIKSADKSDESEDEKEPSAPSKSGAQSFEEDDLMDDDRYFRDHAAYHNKVERAVDQYRKEVQQNPNLPRSLYGLAIALDRLAELKRSNKFLEESIQAYENLLNNGVQVPDALYRKAGDRCINRMRFKGNYGQAIGVHKMLLARFPEDVQVRNQMAVTYLMTDKVEAAKGLLKETLLKWPNNGFAKVHYGFILKTFDNNIEGSVKYLEEGINSKESGVIDGRFYFHLGDALTRLGRHDEAMKIYADGVKQGLFLSKYQRSLYNINRLEGRPWWTKVQTGYEKELDVIERNWKQIRDEAMSLLNADGLFKDEAENLRDVGDWKQFELYSRGRKIQSNCVRAPFTCGLMDGFPAASKCRRGQVKFSVMQSGTHVWPHCGPTNCRLRAHLGLKVPPNTAIRVAEEKRSWKEGEILIFDDSFEHEVWHNGTEPRLILIIDVWHPQLTEYEKNSIPAI